MATSVRRRIGWFLFDFLGLSLISVLTLYFVNGPELLTVIRSQQNTLLCGAMVFMGATFMVHQPKAPLGFRSLGEAIPVLAGLFGIMLLTITIFRIDYSRSILMIFVFCSMIWFQFRLWIMLHYRIQLFWVIPQGEITRLLHTQGRMRFRALTSPDPGGRHTYNDGIVADLRTTMDDKWGALLAYASLQRVPIYDVSSIYEALSGRVSISHLGHAQLNTLLPPKYYLYLKRAMDLFLALLLLILLSPLMLFITALVKLDSPGKTLFVQKRLTLNGEIFNMLKFRSMQKVTSENRYANSTKSQDKRITRIGRILRHFRLDELPQLLNVIKGDMSIVGPRPAVADLSQQYTSQFPFYRHRHLVRPGITGWAQISQGYALDEDIDSTREKIERDFYYIKHLSLWLDVIILILTVAIVLSGRGAR
jgi:lipopolysaccharide/colanic/teichoic acid biosynthesis glycosyltransferase